MEAAVNLAALIFVEVVFLLTLGCSTTERQLHDVARIGDGGAAALVDAAGAGDSEAVQALLDAGADPNVTDADESGWTALTVASAYGHYADLPALTGPGSRLVYAASWFMGNSFPGTMISGAGGR